MSIFCCKTPTIATYYIHDAASNIVAVYEKDLTITASGVLLSELPIVGLERIGNVAITYDASGNPQYGYYYELSDHLRNVRLVFDRTAAVSSGFPVIHYYSDYYSFGLPIADRSSQGYHRYGYQGQDAEYDQSTTNKYSFYWRLYDAEIGRWNNTRLLQNSKTTVIYYFDFS